MTNLIRAEFRKLLTTQVWFWLLLGSIGLTALQATIVVANIGSQFDYDRHAANVFSASGNAFLFVVVLGVIGITAEFRHQTITPTLLATPSRLAVIGSKLISYLLIGAAYALVGLITTIVIAVPWLSGKGIEIGFGDHDIVRTLIGGFVVVTLLAVFGVGVGALITNQAAAITLSIIYLIVIEGLISAIPYVRTVYPYLPGAAAQSMQIASDDRVQQHYTYLEPAVGGVVLVAWTLLLAGAGVWRMNRDVS
jgi:ABC-2 type transport system permease protein